MPSRRLIAALAALLSAGSAMAAPSGTIRLEGTVSAQCTVAVTDANQQLDITGGETGKQVGTVVETCNSSGGYTVTVASANGGVLRTAGGASGVGYTLTYDGSARGLSSPLQVEREGAQFGRVVPVLVSLNPAPNAVAGTYADTITITISGR